ncbi:hypothetical protein B0J17DRAFT_634286 [Rhizoctonia solani]|nr:hypothetical protein B0J17DRAFT_634286 [Rhizoctonia solani]
MDGPQCTTSSRARQQDTTPYSRPLPALSATSPAAAASDATVSDADSNSIPTVARQVTRMVAMFWSPRAVLNAYPELQQAIEDGSEATLRAAASPAEKIYYGICEELERIRPDFFERLGAMESDSTRHVRKDLGYGQSGAKAEDNNKRKSIRGLFHPECARLLAPITVDFDDEEERRQFTECDNPPMTLSHWPRALYLDDNGDPTQPSKGLLQGDLLFKTVKAMLDSPLSVLPSTSVRTNAAKQGRKGIVHKYQLGVVTPALLAYAAVVVEHSNYIESYNQIRCYLESPKYQKTNKILLAWWNKYVTLPEFTTRNDATDGDEPTGMLLLLDAEIERDQGEARGSEDEE